LVEFFVVVLSPCRGFLGRDFLSQVQAVAFVNDSGLGNAVDLSRAASPFPVTSFRNPGKGAARSFFVSLPADFLVNKLAAFSVKVLGLQQLFDKLTRLFLLPTKTIEFP